MATAVEHLYKSCTCENGMRDGARCADCNGRGIVPKEASISGRALPKEQNDLSDADEGDGLEQLGMNELRARAKEVGVGAGGSRAAITERIREATIEDGSESEGTDDETDESDGEDDGEDDGQ